MEPLPFELRLASEAVVLRDWRDADAAALAPVCGEWDVCAFTSVPWDWSEAAALAWIERQRRERAAGTVLALAIQAPGDDRALGNVNLARREERTSPPGGSPNASAPAPRGSGSAATTPTASGGT
jgi:RimJ/RimL family protein N-acetyltransferase